MKPTLTVAVAVALGLVASAGLAFAQSTQPADETTLAPDVPALHPADLNNDGHVTAEEFERFHEALFAQADADNNGRLDRDEVLALPNHRRARGGQTPPAPGTEWRSGKRDRKDRVSRSPEDIFTTLDGNQDGKLERNEVPQGMARHFDRLDANSDDGVTLEEFKEAKPDREAMRKRFEERFKTMDENADGKIQKSEATGRMSEKFDALDANSDGAIDKTELEALRSRFHRHGKDGADDRPRRRQRSGDNPSPASEPAQTPES